jgi:WD40 repeat protein
MLASSSSDGEIKIWDKNYSCLKTIIDHEGPVFSLIQIANIMASSSGSGEIKLWNLDTMEHIVTLTGHTKCVNFLHDLGNDMLASASDDKTVKIWKICGNDSNLLTTLDGHEKSVMCITSPENNHDERIELMTGIFSTCYLIIMLNLVLKYSNFVFSTPRQVHKGLKKGFVYKIN